MMKSLKLLRSYVPDATVGFVPLDPNDQYYGEYEPETGFTFTGMFLQFDEIRQYYVVLHELAHHFTPEESGRHTTKFYDVLTPLIKKHRIPMNVAREIEGIYPSAWVEGS